MNIFFFFETLIGKGTTTDGSFFHLKWKAYKVQLVIVHTLNDKILGLEELQTMDPKSNDWIALRSSTWRNCPLACSGG